jgi:hypothetical protein
VLKIEDTHKRREFIFGIKWKCRNFFLIYIYINENWKKERREIEKRIFTRSVDENLKLLKV